MNPELYCAAPLRPCGSKIPCVCSMADITVSLKPNFLQQGSNVDARFTESQNIYLPIFSSRAIFLFL